MYVRTHVPKYACMYVGSLKVRLGLAGNPETLNIPEHMHVLSCAYVPMISFVEYQSIA